MKGGGGCDLEFEVVVDVRERALWAVLGPDGGGGGDDILRPHIHQQRLDVGDVEIRDRGRGSLPVLTIERKTWGDLTASLTDGRFAEQRIRLAAARAGGGGGGGGDTDTERHSAAYAYVLEAGGGGGTGFSWWGVGGGQGFDGGDNAQQRRTQGALLSLLLTHRVPVVFTRDVHDTAAFVLRACSYLRGRTTHPEENAYSRAACVASACQVRKRDNVDARQCYTSANLL